MAFLLEKSIVGLCLGLLGFNAMWFSALKMRAVCFSETLVFTYGLLHIITQKTNIHIITAVRTSDLLI
jgi:hypothetical protein